MLQVYGVCDYFDWPPIAAAIMLALLEIHLTLKDFCLFMLVSMREM